MTQVKPCVIAVKQRESSPVEAYEPPANHDRLVASICSELAALELERARGRVANAEERLADALALMDGALDDLHTWTTILEEASRHQAKLLGEAAAE